MADKPQGCARVTGAVLGESPPEVSEAPTHHQPTKEDFMAATVGQKGARFQRTGLFQRQLHQRAALRIFWQVDPTLLLPW